MNEEQKLAKALEQFCYRSLRDRQKSGGAKNYRTILTQLSTTTDTAAVIRWLVALSKCASLIDPEENSSFHELVKLIFSFQMPGLPLAAIRAYCGLLQRLASANPSFVNACFKVWVKSFVRVTTADSDDTTAAPVNELHDAVHDTMQQVLNMVPSAPTTLFPILMAGHPYKSETTESQQMYLKNLLRISEYCPTLRDRLLAAIVERFIHIDVEIVVVVARAKQGRWAPADDDDDDNDDDDNDGDDENEANGYGDGDGDGDGDDLDNQQSKLRDSVTRSEMAGKLDSLISMMFEYIRLLCSNDNAKSELTTRTFSALLDVFEGGILRTHKTRFTQYLLFFFCGLSPSHTETFIMRLLQKAFDNDAYLGDRINCTFYLSSFIVRAASLRQVAAITAFDILVKWVLSYITMQKQQWGWEGAVGLEGSSGHTIFYAIAQAVFYIFAYRGDAFAQQASSTPEAIEKYQFGTIVGSLLNPLRFCSQRSVKAFVRATRYLNVLQCEDILRENAKLTRVETAQSPRWSDTKMNTLEREFLPFDPFLLPNSATYITEAELYLPLSQPWTRERGGGSSKPLTTITTTSPGGERGGGTHSPPPAGIPSEEDEHYGLGLRQRYTEELSPLMTPLYMGMGSPMYSPSLDSFRLNGGTPQTMEPFSLNGAAVPVPIPIPIQMGSRQPDDEGAPMSFEESFHAKTSMGGGRDGSTTFLSNVSGRD